MPHRHTAPRSLNPVKWIALLWPSRQANRWRRRLLHVSRRARCKIAVLRWTGACALDGRRLVPRSMAPLWRRSAAWRGQWVLLSTLRCPGLAVEFRLERSLHLRFFAAAESACAVVFHEPSRQTQSPYSSWIDRIPWPRPLRIGSSGSFMTEQAKAFLDRAPRNRALVADAGMTKPRSFPSVQIFRQPRPTPHWTPSKAERETWPCLLVRQALGKYSERPRRKEHSRRRSDGMQLDLASWSLTID